MALRLPQRVPKTFIPVCTTVRNNKSEADANNLLSDSPSFQIFKTRIWTSSSSQKENTWLVSLHTTGSIKLQ